MSFKSQDWEAGWLVCAHPSQHAQAPHVCLRGCMLETSQTKAEACLFVVVHQYDKGPLPRLLCRLLANEEDETEAHEWKRISKMHPTTHQSVALLSQAFSVDKCPTKTCYYMQGPDRTSTCQSCNYARTPNIPNQRQMSQLAMHCCSTPETTL